MKVILYKRHRASCPHRANKHYRRCRCSVWMEYNVKGVADPQERQNAKLGDGAREGPRQRARSTWTRS